MSDTTETETDTNTDNTDNNTDEPTKAELHDRVQQLESTVEKLMPSRRDALKLGAAGIAGAAGLGAASQSAEASTGSAGTIGSSGSRPDLLADDVGPRSIADDYLYAGEFSGGSPEDRLQNAVNQANAGATIYLENASYGSFTINKVLRLVGTYGIFNGNRDGTFFEGTHTFDSQVSIENVIVEFDRQIVINGSRSRISNCSGLKGGDNFLIQASKVLATGLSRGKFRFASGTSGGLIDASQNLTVTDNGTNTIGDVA